MRKNESATENLFNKMINNGTKGQYTRRADDTLAWREGQRSGTTFRARDGTQWDADLHAAELLARWLFLRPKPAAPAAAPTM
jgi:hypothetical protein